MRCNWSKRANFLLRGLAHHDPVSHIGRRTRATFHTQLKKLSKPISKSRPSSLSYNNLQNTVVRGNGRLRYSASALAKVVPEVPISAKSMTTSASSTNPSTDAQISRAAAKAVRLCMRAGEVADAYYIVKSLENPPDIAPPQKTGFAHYIAVPHRPFIPLPFRPTISPRLSAHSLLHALIRVGLTTKAYQLAQSLMESDIKIRPRSLDAVIHALLAQGATTPGFLERRQLDRIDKIITSRRVLTLHPRLIADQSTRYAVRLILQSRHYRQRCTSEAYHSIIRYLLSRAEILVASLLFCLLVKQYQFKHAVAARLRGQIQSVDTNDESEQSLDQKAELQSSLKDVLWEKSIVDRNLAKSLVESVEVSMLQNPQQDINGASLRTSLQALAIIAMLLDERRIPFPEVASIIHALYSCPKSDTKVWIIRDGITVCVEAYGYFHSVLMRLAIDLPTTKPRRRLGKSDPDNSPLPPLDLDSYNSLLHYALRHRHDLALAKNVLHHMHNRPKPLEPDIVTYNILIRSGTLLRRVDITEEALESLRRNTRNAKHGIMVTPSGAHTPAQQHTMRNGMSSPKPIPRQIRRHGTPSSSEMGLLAVDEPTLPPDPPTADGYTLTSYIMHLASTGRPHVVAEILFHVLPELSMIDHPSWGPMTHRQAIAFRKSRMKSRREQLHRAASFGPNFFTTMLNSLRKSGKTGLTERVWLLAKQAERISWMTEGISPWFLPVHAYTIMLQCYADEARKGSAMGWNHENEDQQHDWRPLSKQRVRGWARFVLSQRTIARDTPRHIAARCMSMQLYGSMMNGAQEVINSFLKLNALQNGSSVAIPRPDARFFNAALKLFTQKKGRVKANRSRWRRRLRYAQMQYARSGASPTKLDSTVRMIVEEMVKYGFSVPIGLRPMFIGHVSSRFMFHGERRELDQRPFAFPPVSDNFRSHGLSTIKTRGLPAKRHKNRQRFEVYNQTRTLEKAK
jgi:hypothetical protein